METQLFIPSKIRVGWQKREDTYSKKLAYIIYFDSKGKIRKETSWNSWRDKTIDFQDFDNTPTSGFVLNKGVKRCHDWFGSGRSMIRVYDPREIEFEITVSNLIGVLMNSDCSKRQLMGEYLYAWYGTELVLLPCESEEYQKAATFTSLQSKKIKSKELIPGASYKTKKEEDLVYVGRFNWYDWDFFGYKRGGEESPKPREAKLKYIFTRNDGETFEDKSELKFLATQNTDEPVANYADIIDKFKNCIKANNIVKWELVPTKFTNEEWLGEHNEKLKSEGKLPEYIANNLPYYLQLKKTSFFRLYNNLLREISINYSGHRMYHHKDVEIKYHITNSHLIDITKIVRINEESKERKPSYGYGWNQRPTEYTLADVSGLNDLNDLFVTLENGNRIQINSLTDLR